MIRHALIFPALLLALNSPLFTIVGVLLVFGIEQFLEGHLLVPYFTGRQVELGLRIIF